MVVLDVVSVVSQSSSIVPSEAFGEAAPLPLHSVLLPREAVNQRPFRDGEFGRLGEQLPLSPTTPGLPVGRICMIQPKFRCWTL